MFVTNVIRVKIALSIVMHANNYYIDIYKVVNTTFTTLVGFSLYKLYHNK